MEINPGDVPSGAFPLALLAVPEYFSITTGATLNLEGRTQDGPTVEWVKACPPCLRPGCIDSFL